jgi:hypothetical protein
MSEHPFATTESETFALRIKELWNKMELPLTHHEDGLMSLSDAVVDCEPYCILIQLYKDTPYVHMEIHLKNHFAKSRILQEPLLNTINSLPNLASLRRFKKNWEQEGHNLENAFRLQATLSVIFSTLIPEDIP